MERPTVYALLDELAESPAPPSTVDIAQATAAGRRTIRIRRMLTAGTAAIAGVLGVVVAGGTHAAPQPAPIVARAGCPEPT
jgi:hypothetical protein